MKKVKLIAAVIIIGITIGVMTQLATAQSGTPVRDFLPEGTSGCT